MNLHRKIPILAQLILGFSIILLTVVIVTIYFSYRNSAYVLLKNTNQYLNESVYQMNGKIDVILQEFDKFSRMVAFSSVMQDFLTKVDRKELTSGQSQFEIERFIADQSKFLGGEGLTLIHIMDNRNGYYSANTSISLLWNRESEMKEQPWFRTVEDGRGKMVWFSSDVWTNGTTRAVIGARQINDWGTLRKIGHLFFAFPVDQLSRTVGQMNLGRSGKVQIVDGFGQIVYSTDERETGAKIGKRLAAELQAQQNKLFRWTENGQDMFIVHSHSDYSDWTVIAYIGAGEAFKDLNAVGKSTTLIVALGIFAAFLFASFFSWTLSRPIRRLAKRLGRLNKGALRPVNGKTGNREVSILYESFNNMIEHLNQTIKDLSDKKISEQQAQLVALKAQIRPHFLYNSLNTIYWSLINEKRDKEAEMVLALSDLMRYSIQPGSEQVTVEEDVNQLKKFIFISKLRYGEKLHVDINLDADTPNLKMMKLLLQPLVENAISHGLEPVKGPWNIAIRIFRAGNVIRFVVEDNGIGMNEEEMQKVLLHRNDPKMEKSLHSGIGLANLNYRIGIIYGKEYGLALSRSELGGLKVEVSLPVAPEDQSDMNAKGGAVQ